MLKQTTKDIKFVIIGASLGGLSTGVSLLNKGYDVRIYERTNAFRTGGAGLGLTAETKYILDSLNVNTKFILPMNGLETRHRNGNVIFRSNNIEYYRCYWRDIYNALIEMIPKNKLFFNHNCININKNENGNNVTIKPTEKDSFEESFDYLIGADGSKSIVREFVRGKDDLLYTGYVAFRGYIDFNDSSTFNCSEERIEEFRKLIMKNYAELGNVLYYNVTDHNSSNVFYMLSQGLINWMWYIYRDLPPSQGQTLTYFPNDDELKQYFKFAEEIWGEEFNQMIKLTAKPFVTPVFDRDPVDNFVYDNVILIGDAAHPSRPHRGASTSMAIKDGWTLANTIAEKGIEEGLKVYNKLRTNETANIVSQSRYLGELRQSKLFPEIDWSQSNENHGKLHGRKTPTSDYFK